jgi:hypothetical protein
MHRGRRVAAGIAGVNGALHYIAIFMHSYALTDIPTLPILQGVSRKFVQSPGLPIFIKFSRFFRIFRKYRKKIINVLFLAT